MAENPFEVARLAAQEKLNERLALDDAASEALNRRFFQLEETVGKLQGAYEAQLARCVADCEVQMVNREKNREKKIAELEARVRELEFRQK